MAANRPPAREWPDGTKRTRIEALNAFGTSASEIFGGLHEISRARLDNKHFSDDASTPKLQRGAAHAIDSVDRMLEADCERRSAVPGRLDTRVSPPPDHAWLKLAVEKRPWRAIRNNPTLFRHADVGDCARQAHSQSSKRTTGTPLGTACGTSAQRSNTRRSEAHAHEVHELFEFTPREDGWFGHKRIDPGGEDRLDRTDEKVHGADDWR